MEAIHSVQNAIDFMEEQLYEHLELEQIAAIAYILVPSWVTIPLSKNYWLYQNVDYIQDERRHWYAKYTPDIGKDLKGTTRVTCYVPVILKNKTLNI